MYGVTFEDVERYGLERWLAEADPEPTAYGHRPGRSALEAVQEVHRELYRGPALRAHAPGI